MSQERLGRLYAPDDRDADFQMRQVVPRAAPTRVWRYWYAYHHYLNQGFTPHCVDYSLSHYLLDAPNTHPIGYQNGELYRAAQLVDEWPGEDYDGTSVRAGAKVLQRWGYIDSYWWAWDIATINDALLTTGPVVVGTNWYTGMFEPDDEGFLRITGRIEGGHAWVLNGINLSRGIYRMKQSWDPDWGKNSHALIAIEDFQRLLHEAGEAMLATETRPT